MPNTPSGSDRVSVFTDDGREFEVDYARALVLLKRDGYRKTAPAAKTADTAPAKPKKTAKKV